MDRCPDDHLTLNSPEISLPPIEIRLLQPDEHPVVFRWFEPLMEQITISSVIPLDSALLPGPGPSPYSMAESLRVSMTSGTIPELITDEDSDSDSSTATSASVLDLSMEYIETEFGDHRPPPAHSTPFRYGYGMTGWENFGREPESAHKWRKELNTHEILPKPYCGLISPPHGVNGAYGVEIDQQPNLNNSDVASQYNLIVPSNPVQEPVIASSSVNEDQNPDENPIQVQGRHQFSCDECGLSFYYKYQLARHRVTHSNERPFKCDRCEVAFKRRHNRTRHIIAVHDKIKKKRASGNRKPPLREPHDS